MGAAGSRCGYSAGSLTARLNRVRAASRMVADASRPQVSSSASPSHILGQLDRIRSACGMRSYGWFGRNPLSMRRCSTGQLGRVAAWARTALASPIPLADVRSPRSLAVHRSHTSLAVRAAEEFAPYSVRGREMTRARDTCTSPAVCFVAARGNAAAISARIESTQTLAFSSGRSRSSITGWVVRAVWSRWVVHWWCVWCRRVGGMGVVGRWAGGRVGECMVRTVRTGRMVRAVRHTW